LTGDDRKKERRKLLLVEWIEVAQQRGEIEEKNERLRKYNQHWIQF
jgi:hypothetical protein